MVKITHQMLTFIRDNKDLIARGDFKAFYARATASGELIGSEIGSITWLFYQAGVDPLPDLPVVPEYFLHDCKDVERFIIPDGPILIKRSAFAWCVNLREVTIPASVREIAPTAFDTCDTLKDIYYGGTKEQWIVVGNMLRSIAVAVRKTKIHCSNGDLILSGGTGQWVEVDN